jgi:hypothetical protein
LGNGDILALIANWLGDQDQPRGGGRLTAALDAAFPLSDIERMLAGGTDPDEPEEIAAAETGPEEIGAERSAAEEMGVGGSSVDEAGPERIGAERIGAERIGAEVCRRLVVALRQLQPPVDGPLVDGPLTDAPLVDGPLVDGPWVDSAGEPGMARGPGEGAESDDAAAGSQPDSWLADLSRPTARTEFLCRVEELLTGRPGRALVLNLVGAADDLAGLAGDPRPLVVLAPDLPDPTETIPLAGSPSSTQVDLPVDATAGSPTKKARTPAADSRPTPAWNMSGCLRLLLVPLAVVVTLALFAVVYYLR